MDDKKEIEAMEKACEVELPLFAGFVRNHTHNSGLPTERAAAEKAGIKAGSIKDQILQDLDFLEDYGMTPDEFCEQTKGLINTIRRRFTDLWKEGRIRHHPETKTRLNSAGNDCVVWVLGRDDNITPSRIELLNAEIKRLRDTIASQAVDCRCDVCLQTGRIVPSTDLVCLLCYQKAKATIDRQAEQLKAKAEDMAVLHGTIAELTKG